MRHKSRPSRFPRRSEPVAFDKDVSAFWQGWFRSVGAPVLGLVFSAERMSRLITNNQIGFLYINAFNFEPGGMGWHDGYHKLHTVRCCGANIHCSAIAELFDHCSVVGFRLKNSILARMFQNGGCQLSESHHRVRLARQKNAWSSPPRS